MTVQVDEEKVNEYVANLLKSHQSLAEWLDVKPKDGKISIREWLAGARDHDAIQAAEKDGSLCGKGELGEGKLLDRWMSNVKSKFPMAANKRERDEFVKQLLEDVYDKEQYEISEASYRLTFERVAAKLKAQGIDVSAPEDFAAQACKIVQQDAAASKNAKSR